MRLGRQSQVLYFRISLFISLSVDIISTIHTQISRFHSRQFRRKGIGKSVLKNNGKPLCLAKVYGTQTLNFEIITSIYQTLSYLQEIGV